jgi:hypothetical protein
VEDEDDDKEDTQLGNQSKDDTWLGDRTNLKISQALHGEISAEADVA